MILTLSSFQLKKRKNCIFCKVALDNSSRFIYAELICFPCYSKLSTIKIGPDYCYELIKCKEIKKYEDFSVITLSDNERLLIFSTICHKHSYIPPMSLNTQ